MKTLNLNKLFNIIISFFNLKSFTFSIFFYFFLNSVFFGDVALNFPTNYLNFHKIGNHKVYFFGDIKYKNTFDLVKHIKYNPLNNLNFKLYMPNEICLRTFPHTHPFTHPHLNIGNYNNVIENIFVNIQMSSSNFNDCFFLSEFNVNGIFKSQFVANNLYLYDNNIINSYFNKSFDNTYLNNHNIKFDKYFKNIIRKHEI